VKLYTNITTTNKVGSISLVVLKNAEKRMLKNTVVPKHKNKG